MRSAMRQCAIPAILLSASFSYGGASSSLPIFGKKELDVGRAGIPAYSKLGAALLSRSRALENEDANFDISYVAGYSIKFQGCHHISQWNEYAEDEDDVRVHTKRLVRFRLCPLSSCNDDYTTGCSSKYGDYVVDMNEFVDYYLQAREDEMYYKCQEYEEICNDKCNGDDECVTACYYGYGLSYCYQNDDDAAAAFEPADYSYCAQFDLANGRRERRQLDGDAAYYVGPYCADQGGEIHLGLFSDDTCTSFVYNGESTFYSSEGYELPYSDESLVTPTCMQCKDPNGNDDDENAEVKELCENIYKVSGKCETKMNVEYPNESACTYIEGIKIIREDGVIRTNSIRKSKLAAVTIGLFTTVAVLLAAYVYYLRTKLSRAKINLTSASAGLT